MRNNTYPQDVYFDIETLINVAQPSSILLIGEQTSDFLDNYREQKQILNQSCTIDCIRNDEIDSLAEVPRHDVAIAIDVFEHIDKQTGYQLLSRLRDLLAQQYCIALPFCGPAQNSTTNSDSHESWLLTDLFGFALQRVAVYENAASDNSQQIGLFKYNIKDYKKTPDWLNSDNWANPEMWEKYRW